MRKATLDFGFGGEPPSTFATWLEPVFDFHSGFSFSYGLPVTSEMGSLWYVNPAPNNARFRNNASIRQNEITMIRVILPYHLRNLAHVGSEVTLDVPPPVTINSVLDALEARYPMLCGTIRDHVTKERRAFLRFFACEQDLSHDPPDTPLPEEIVSGKEPFLVIGAIAGG